MASVEPSSVKLSLPNLSMPFTKADQEGTVLTSEFLNNLYAELNEKYYGLSKMTTLKSSMNGLGFLTSTITTMFSNIQQGLQQLQP